MARRLGDQGCEFVCLVSCACVQTKSWCTSGTARKVVVILTVVALTTEAVSLLCWHLTNVSVVNTITAVVLRTIVPVAALWRVKLLSVVCSKSFFVISKWRTASNVLPKNI